MLPIGRWKGYGGDSDYQGATFETVTWACGLLAATRRLVVFGTVHAPLIPPLIAAKEFVTADHIGEGRFGLNIVCGWNEGEFEMFGATLRDHETRYDYAQEWLDVVKLAWSARGRCRFRRAFLPAEGRPGQAQTLWREPAADHECRRLADRPGLRHPQLRCAVLERVARDFVRGDRARTSKTCGRSAARPGREIDVYTVGVVTCRPTAKEAQDYYRHCIVDNADWRAVDSILAMKNVTADNHGPEEFQRIRNHQANGMGGLPLDRRPRHRGAGAGAACRRGAHRDRGLVCQLSRGAAVFLRRGVAAPGAAGAARKGLTPRPPQPQVICQIRLHLIRPFRGRRNALVRICPSADPGAGPPRIEMAVGMSICNSNTAWRGDAREAGRRSRAAGDDAPGDRLDRVTVQQRKRVMMPEKLIIVGRVGTDLWACMKRRLEWGHSPADRDRFPRPPPARFTTAPCRLSRPRRRGAWRANAGRCRCGG